MIIDQFLKVHCSDDADPDELKIWRVWYFMTGMGEMLNASGVLNPSGNSTGTASGSQLAWKEFLTWPPDVFALCSAILRRSGCYTVALSNGACPRTDEIEALAMCWRKWFAIQLPDGTIKEQPPDELAGHWEMLWKCRNASLFRIAECDEVMRKLILMMAAADEVSRGSGLPFQTSEPPGGWRPEDIGHWRLIWHGWERLAPARRGSSLCSSRIHPNVARVLPKTHVAGGGLTIRSFSHHLALCESDEVQPRWFMIPGSRGDEGNEKHVNLVVLPWPLKISPNQFQISKQRTPDEKDHFDFKSARLENLADLIDSVCREAQDLLGSVDAVIMPELALDVAEYEAIRARILSRRVMLVAGVGREATDTKRGVNEVCVDIPLSEYHAVHFRQAKHHRWKLDRDQIINYGIGSRLDHSRSYWENIDINDRRLLFLVLRPWFVASMLICEDLARHDPVGELLRGVGPHFVAALLMDGPQLNHRWSSRYAAVLADDPGSSVLSISSLGMVGLSRPNPTERPSRVTALWKDSRRGAKELWLAEGASAFAITISVENQEEDSADGRKFPTARPVLTGVHMLGERLKGGSDRPAEEPQVTFLAPNEAVDLGRLAQQLRSPDESPEVLMELSGEAREIGLEICRLSQPSPMQADVSDRDEDALMSEEQRKARRYRTKTAEAICFWRDQNLKQR